MKIQYIEKRFSVNSLLVISQANKIINEYKAEGLSLTLRQLYYQFVSRDLLSNKQKEYTRLGGIISDARLSGLVDWKAIEDRTRNLKQNYHNTDPGQAIQDSLDQFLLDKWVGQTYRPEVWIEKEALTGVIAKSCREFDVPYFACKGYNSQSEMWRAGQRFEYYAKNKQLPIVIHLGDHDPSGIDMTRDTEDRLELFMGGLEVKRIALNYDQIEKYNPPPNPAKMSDSRAENYVNKFGNSSWELDALEPKIMHQLIRETIDNLIDHDRWEETLQKENEYRKIMEKVVKTWKTL